MKLRCAERTRVHLRNSTSAASQARVFLVSRLEHAARGPVREFLALKRVRDSTNQARPSKFRGCYSAFDGSDVAFPRLGGVSATGVVDTRRPVSLAISRGFAASDALVTGYDAPPPSVRRFGPTIAFLSVTG